MGRGGLSLPGAFAAFIGAVPLRPVRLPWGPTAVWDLGAGPPVVLLHGIAGSRRLFFRIAPLLAERGFRVLAPLLRGETEPVRRIAWEELVEDLEALLDALELERAALFAVSFGVPVAVRFAACRPGRVERLVLQGGFLRFRLRPADRLALRLAPLAPPSLGARYFARRVFRGPETRLLAAHAPGLEQLVPDWSARTPFRSLRARVHLITHMDLRAEAGRLAMPVTIAHGRLDRVVPLDPYHLELRAACPRARAVLWEDAGHLAPLTHPELCADLVARDQPSAGRTG